MIEASVWITLRIGKPLGASIWRWSAETMPVVTVREKPNGLPIAIDGVAHLDLRGVAQRQRHELGVVGVDLQHGEVVRRVPALDLGVHEVALLAEADVDLVAPSTTCALVMIVPSLSTTKPEPVAVPPWSGQPEGGLLARADALGADEDHAAALVLVDVGDGAARRRRRSRSPGG